MSRPDADAIDVIGLAFWKMVDQHGLSQVEVSVLINLILVNFLYPGCEDVDGYMEKLRVGVHKGLKWKAERDAKRARSADA